MKVIIVHGCGNCGFVLDGDSTDRIKKTLELLRMGSYDTIIVTGGIFKESQKNISVAHAMKHTLENCWVTEESIKVGAQSLTTIDNVEKISSLINNEDDLTVVTSNYHVFRTQLIWLLVGKRNVKVIGANSKITLKKLFIEVVGIGITIAYAINFKWPELYFRAKVRTIKSAD